MSKNIKISGIVFVISLFVLMGCAGKQPVKKTVEIKVVELAPQEQVAPKDTIPTLDQITAKLSTIHFDFDKYAIRTGDAEILKVNAEVLKVYPDVKVLIEGNCDSRGTDAYNMALGEKRANAAKDFLVKLGLADARFSTISYGEENSVDPAQNETGWAKNREVIPRKTLNGKPGKKLTCSIRPRPLRKG